MLTLTWNGILKIYCLEKPSCRTIHLCLKLHVFVCLLDKCVLNQVPRCAYKGHRRTSGSSLSVVWVSEVELRSSGLVVSAFTSESSHLSSLA